MIIFVTTADHRYTTRKLLRQSDAPVIRQWSWGQLFTARFFPRATYVLTDFDRLRTADVEQAGQLHDSLVRRGMRVLNDPRLYLPRDIFLRRLHREGLNSFTCWRPGEGERPDRFPVFVRTIAAHRGVLSGLLNSQCEVDDAIAAALKAGHPLLDLLVVQYAAAADDAGTFEKRSAYVIGDAVVPGSTLNQGDWVIKQGELGRATEEGYRRQLQEARDMPHADQLRRVFAVGGATYGRIDYTILNGRLEIYELNTNPALRFMRKHPNADRVRTVELITQLFIKALRTIDTAAYSEPLIWCESCGKFVTGRFGVPIHKRHHPIP